MPSSEIIPQIQPDRSQEECAEEDECEIIHQLSLKLQACEPFSEIFQIGERKVVNTQFVQYLPVPVGERAVAKTVEDAQDAPRTAG